MGPKSNDWCPYEKRRGHRDTQRRGDMRTEIIEIHLQAKDCQDLSDAGRGEKSLPLEPSKGT